MCRRLRRLHRAFESLVEQHLRVQRQGAAGDEGGCHHDGGNDGEMHPGDVGDGAVDVAIVRLGDAIDVSAQQRAADGVDNNVRGVQEGHHGPQGRHVPRRGLTARKRGLDVGCQRNISGRPTEGDGDVGGKHHPGGPDLFCGVPAGEKPDDQQQQRVQPEPRDWGADPIGEQEHKQRT